jgi:acetyltransferase
MASSDSAVEALFRKAGIVRCYGREELTTVAGVLMSRKMEGKNMAIITHAGGPAVMLSDALEAGGLTIPHLPDGTEKERLKAKLFPGSSVGNPIDFLEPERLNSWASLLMPVKRILQKSTEWLLFMEALD